jgi:hypothetical protein
LPMSRSSRGKFCLGKPPAPGSSSFLSRMTIWKPRPIDLPFPGGSTGCLPCGKGAARPVGSSRDVGRVGRRCRKPSDQPLAEILRRRSPTRNMLERLSRCRLGYFGTMLPCKAALMTAANLSKLPRRRWAALGRDPRPGFPIALGCEPAGSDPSAGAVVVKEFTRSATTEVFEISDQGISAGGDFPSSG